MKPATSPSAWIDHPDTGAAQRFLVALFLLTEDCKMAETAVNIFNESNAAPKRESISATQEARRRALIAANSLVFAVDNFVKKLEVLEKDEQAPQVAISQAIAVFNAKVPGAKPLRNTLHHLEDRARGLDHRKRPITPNEVDIPGVYSGRSMFLNNVSDDTIHGTAADGSLASMEVSMATVDKMSDALQAVIDAFSWRPGGFPTKWPAY